MRTRARHLMIPTQLANVLYESGMQLLPREVDGTAVPPDRHRPVRARARPRARTRSDLLEPQIARRAAAERAMDRVRNRFGQEAVIRGKLIRAGAKARAAPAAREDAEEGKPEMTTPIQKLREYGYELPRRRGRPSPAMSRSPAPATSSTSPARSRAATGRRRGRSAWATP